MRISPWPNGALSAVAAQLAPVPGAALPTPDEIRVISLGLARRGYERAITIALPPAEQVPFREAGFLSHEDLHLLTHDLGTVPPRSRRTRRAHRGDWPAIVEVDTAAFTELWRLDRDGLEHAMSATPIRRLRVTEDDATGEVVGYALTGRAATTGYLQRLGVHPSHQGRGLGRALAVDSLHWLRRHHVDRVLVNTQVTNEVAFRLYRDLGYVPDAAGLTVLVLPLTAGVPE